MAIFYGTLEEASEYHESRGNSEWAEAEEADQEAALVRGSSYIDAVYGQRFSGTPVDELEQDLAWPRSDAYTNSGVAIPNDLVPRNVKYAAYDAALLELNEKGILNQIVISSQTVTREKVGELEVSYSSGSGTSLENSRPLLSSIEGYLAMFLGCKMFPAIECV